MNLKVLNQLNPVFPMKAFTKPNCSLFTKKRLMKTKMIHNKQITIMKKL